MNTEELLKKQDNLLSKLKYEILYKFILSLHEEKKIGLKESEIIEETLEYFIEKEEFEKCIDLKKIKKSLNQYLLM